MQLNPHDGRHWPFIGSVLEFLDERRGKGQRREVPPNIALPWLLSSRRDHPSKNGGPYGAFLSSRYDPVWTEFEGEGTRLAKYTFDNRTLECLDPFGGIKPDGRFGLSSAATLPADITLDRLNGRKSLLEQFDQARLHGESTRSHDRFQELALSFLTSDKMRHALDVRREPAAMRQRYGMHLFGQSTLVARRLIEAGAKFVTVFWDEFGLVNSAWDTHYYHYDLMKNQLGPGFDQAFSALILDLEARGMLDETLVLCITEHGRTPKINNLSGGGRDHWSRAYSSIFAGGGIARGKAVGKTDRIAGEVVETPISPKDILATTYHLLGIDPHTIIYDRLNRPVPVAGEGQVRFELLA
jgi:hypothetical protein